MKKLVLIFGIIAGTTCFTKAQNVNIPDANFKAYLVGNTSINTNRDSEIQVSEAVAFKGAIDCVNKNIYNLTGIEAFVNIKELYCHNNKLTSLDVSNNTALIFLRCERNQLTSLDVSKNTTLINLGCDLNQLTSLDVSKNTALTYLSCYNNQLTSLDASKNTALTHLSCHSNQLTSLDVSKNTALTYLSCYSNQLTSLNIKNGSNSEITTMIATINPNLTCIQVDNVANANSYTTIGFWQKGFNADYNTNCNPSTGPIVNIPDANFKAYLVDNTAINTDGDSEIQISEAEAFTGTINCSFRNIYDLAGIEAFVNIKELYCNGNTLTSFDVSKNTALITLVCNENKLTSLDVSKNTNLTTLSCTFNSLTSLDLSKNTALTTLTCNYNQLTSLDVSKNTALTFLSCHINELTSLDVSKNTALKYLDCRFNQLKSLDVKNGNNTSMTSLYASFNTYLTCIQVDNVSNANSYTDDFGYWEKDAFASYNTNCNTDPIVNIPDANFKAYLVGSSDINTNGDNEIQVSEAEAFTGYINASSKNIASMVGIEAFVKITKLECQFNQILSLDISKNTLLTYLDCSANQLTSLDLSKNTILEDIRCRTNQLAELNLSKNTVLTYINCRENQLTNLNLKNGNNSAITGMLSELNPQLICIQVDNVVNANSYTTAGGWIKDATASYNTDCNPIVGCTNNTTGISPFPTNILTPTCTGNAEPLYEQSWAGEDSRVQVSTGVSYTFSSSVATDYITITNVDASVIYASGISNVTWTSQTDQVIRFYIHLNEQCAGHGSTGTDRTKFAKCNGPTLQASDITKKEFSVYPNPVKSIANFSEEVSNIKITDLTGRTVKQIPASAKSVNVATLEKGTYIITGTTKSGNTITKKLIKE